MSVWIPIDQTELDLQQRKFLKGAPVLMTPSPYDIPEAFMFTRLPSGIFEINFRYMLSDEPVDTCSFGLFDLELGHNSRRLYRMVGYCQEREIQACIEHLLFYMKVNFPRRAGNYTALAAVINRYLQGAA